MSFLHCGQVMSVMDINYAMETTSEYIKVQLVQTSRSIWLLPCAIVYLWSLLICVSFHICINGDGTGNEKLFPLSLPWSLALIYNNMFKIWSSSQIWSFSSVIWLRIFGHPVFIYSVIRFRSNRPTSDFSLFFDTACNSNSSFIFLDTCLCLV